MGFKFWKFNEDVNCLNKNLEATHNNINDTREELNNTSAAIDQFDREMRELAARIGITLESKNSLEEMNSVCNAITLTEFDTDVNKKFYLNKYDVVTAGVIGGLAVLLDFMVVKIPKDTLYTHDGIHLQEGSPLTEFLRSIGFDENGKTSSWVRELEKKFPVPYDPSVGHGVPGMNPKVHRMMGLGHDPIFGLLFGIYDILTGSFTSIGKDGILRIERLGESSGKTLLEAVLLWAGHLFSDIFTKMGIPLPGWGALQVLRFGSIGEKERTVADIARYMYANGYDIRHFVSMSTVPAVIELLTRIYFCFFGKVNPVNQTVSEIEFTQIKNDIKLHKMLIIASAIGTGGNFTKIVINGNPLEFNFPVWLQLLKESVVAVKIATRTTKSFEKVIENRHDLDYRWYVLQENMKRLKR